MNSYIIEIHGEIKGDCEIVTKYEEPKTKNNLRVFNKLRDEIEQEKVGYPPSAAEYKTINKVLQIIDKYKTVMEETWIINFFTYYW